MKMAQWEMRITIPSSWLNWRDEDGQIYGIPVRKTMRKTTKTILPISWSSWRDPTSDSRPQALAGERREGDEKNISFLIWAALKYLLSNIFSQMSNKKDQMWGRSDGNHVVRIFKYQIEECEGHHVEIIKYKIEEPPHHVVRVLLLKPDEGWACGGGLCKKIEPNKKFHKIKTLPVLSDLPT